MRPLHTALLTLGLSAAAAYAEQKPNIVLLYIDDWAWSGSSVRMNDDMVNSAVDIVPTPNVERMAAEGMKFSSAYGSHQCAPARAALQTGQSVARTGFTLVVGTNEGDYYNTRGTRSKMPVLPNISDVSLDADAITIPELLKPLGYVSAHLGKWHLYSDPAAEGYVLHSGDTTNNEGNTRGGNKGDLDDPKLMFSLTDQAIEFMEEQVSAKQPFYLQLSHYAVHNGAEALSSTTEALAGSMPARSANYFAMTQDLDTNIGRVLDSIESLGIADNTYVILVSDNGYRRKNLEEDPEFSQPLHGHKWWAWEAGIRVPMIVMGPGIAKGSKFDANVINYDFLPTFIDWAGGDSTQLENIDGVSLAPYLAGAAIDEEFKNRPLYLHVPHYRNQKPHSTVIAGDYKVMHFYDTPDTPMLFNLREDPGERTNVAKSFPEKHGQLLDGMMTYLDTIGARIPKINPDYDEEFYKNDYKDYQRIELWGAFEGTRPLAADEK